MGVALRSIRVAASVVLVCWSTGLLLTGAARAQEGPEANRKIAGGGITAPGWMGTVDADSAKAGQSEKDAKLVQKGGEFDPSLVIFGFGYGLEGVAYVCTHQEHQQGHSAAHEHLRETTLV